MTICKYYAQYLWIPDHHTHSQALIQQSPQSWRNTTVKDAIIVPSLELRGRAQTSFSMTLLMCTYQGPWRCSLLRLEWRNSNGLYMQRCKWIHHSSHTVLYVRETGPFILCACVRWIDIASLFYLVVVVYHVIKNHLPVHTSYTKSHNS